MLQGGCDNLQCHSTHFYKSHEFERRKRKRQQRMFGVVRTALRGARRGVMSSKRGNVGYYKGEKNPLCVCLWPLHLFLAPPLRSLSTFLSSPLLSLSLSLSLSLASLSLSVSLSPLRRLFLLRFLFRGFLGFQQLLR